MGQNQSHVTVIFIKNENTFLVGHIQCFKLEKTRSLGLSPKLLNFEFGDNCQVKKTNLTRKLDLKRTKADSSSLRVPLFSKIEYFIQFLAKICYKFDVIHIFRSR